MEKNDTNKSDHRGSYLEAASFLFLSDHDRHIFSAAL